MTVSSSLPATAGSLDDSGIRLALFSDTFLPQVNGVTRTLDRLTKAVKARGGAVRTFTVDDPASEDSTQDDISRYPSRPFWLYRELRMSWPSKSRILEQLQSFAPTICHLATPFGLGLAGKTAARSLNVPIVSSYHTSLSAYASHYGVRAVADPLWKYLRWFHNSTLKTFCPTQSIVDEVQSHGFENTGIWSRGVDTTQFSPVHRSHLLRSAMGAEDRTLVVTYVGRLAAEKGLNVAVEAIRIAENVRPGRIIFSCIGDGPYEETVRRMAPLTSWIPGKLSGKQLSETYASGDVFLFPSTTDTFGNVLLEAMASGMPVIGADVGPTRELVGTDRGWLAPAGDAEAIARILVNLVDSPAMRIAPRTRALDFAYANTWDAVWDRLFSDYRNVTVR